MFNSGDAGVPFPRSQTMKEQAVMIEVDPETLVSALEESNRRGLTLSEFTALSWSKTMGAESPEVATSDIPSHILGGIEDFETFQSRIEGYETGEMDHITEGYLWGQFSKFLPAKFTLRILAQGGDGLTIAQWQDIVREHAYGARDALRNKDVRLRIPRGNQLAAGFPRGDGKNRVKSMERFLNHFTVVVQGGGKGRVVGMCAEMGLISVDKDSKTVRLTDAGLDFAKLRNPQLDESGDSYSSISEDESSMLLGHMKANLPKDWEFCRQVMMTINDGTDTSEALEQAVMDRLEGNKDLDWRELENSGFGTYVRGALGRVGALGLLDRSWEGRLVSYSLTESGLREIGE